MGSFAEAQILRELKDRVAALEALVAADPAIERVQRLEMRVGSLQSQINLLRSKGMPATPQGHGTPPVEAKADAAA